MSQPENTMSTARRQFGNHNKLYYYCRWVTFTLHWELYFCVPLSHVSVCLWGASGGKLTVNLLMQYANSSWVMTHSHSQPSISCGAERSLKGFRKWWSHAWGVMEDMERASLVRLGQTSSKEGLSAQLTLSATFRLSSIVRARVAYWQGHWFPD